MGNVYHKIQITFSGVLLDGSESSPRQKKREDRLNCVDRKEEASITMQNPTLAEKREGLHYNNNQYNAKFTLV